MAETTEIAWTDATWNPWYGCRKVSPGCKFCYMYRDMERYGKDPMTVQRSKTNFKTPLKWRISKLIFTCSWSDWFIEEADQWRDEAWEIISRTPHHAYQILTKRPERILDHLPSDWGDGYPNVWLGVSVESQEYANKRIPLLLQVPAQVRFLSCEPLLGLVEFQPEWLRHSNGAYSIHWVICGGESGYPGKYRPMELDWARAMRDQCNATGVPFFLKQLGGPVGSTGAHDHALLDGEPWTEMPLGGRR